MPSFSGSIGVRNSLSRHKKGRVAIWAANEWKQAKAVSKRRNARCA